MTPDAEFEVSANGAAGDVFMVSSDDGNDGDYFIVADGGNVGAGINTPGAKLHVAAPTFTNTGLIVQSTDNFTTNNLMEWQNSAGTAVATMLANGDFMARTMDATNYVVTPLVKTSTNPGVYNTLDLSGGNNLEAWNGVAGDEVNVEISPTIAQGGTAGYKALYINPTESTVGTGDKFLIEGAVSGTKMFAVNIAGDIHAHRICDENGANCIDIDLGFGSADNLGNHTATTHLNMDRNWIGGDATGLGTEGIFVDTAGRVGIGADTPGGHLHLGTGNILLKNTFAILMDDNVGTPSNVLQTTVANNVILGSPTLGGSILYNVRSATGSHEFISNGAETARLTNAGDMGLGDTTPDARLEVSANGAAGDVFMVSGDDANVGDYFIVADGGNVGEGTNGPSAKFHVQVPTSSNTGMLIQTSDDNPANNLLEVHNNAGTPLTVIDSAGKIGVGTTSPLAKIHINETDGDPKLYIVNDDSTSSHRPGILILNADGAANGGAPQIELVNIGGSMASPSALGANTDIATYSFNAHTGVSMTSVASIKARTGANFGAADQETEMNFYVRNDTSDVIGMKITQDAQVWIDTLCDENGANCVDLNTGSGGADNLGDHVMDQNLDANNFDIISNTGLDLIIDADADSSAEAFTIGHDTGPIAELFRVQEDGRVGIGEAAPGAKLHIATGTITEKGAIIKAEAGQTANMQEWQISSGTAVSWVDEVGRMRVMSPGTGGEPFLAVGGGTTIGNNSLVVVPGNAAWTAQTIRGAAAQTGNLLLLEDSAGTDMATFDAAGNLIFQSAGTNNIDFDRNVVSDLITISRTDGTMPGTFRTNGWGHFSFSNSLGVGYDLNGIGGSAKNVLVSGNIGIGTDNPSTDLDIDRADSANFVQVKNTSSTADRFPGYSATNYAGATNGYPNVNLRNSRGNEGTPATMSTDETIAKMTFDAYDGAGFAQVATIEAQTGSAFANGDEEGQLVFSTSNTGALAERMRIDEQGFVGINEANPTTFLHSSGGIRFTGIGESAGRVLTTDANENATWHAPGAGADDLGDHIMDQNLNANNFGIITNTSFNIDIDNDTGGTETFSVSSEAGANTLLTIAENGDVTIPTGGRILVDSGGTQDGHLIGEFQVNYITGGNPGIASAGGTTIFVEDDLMLRGATNAFLGASNSQTTDLVIIHERSGQDIQFHTNPGAGATEQMRLDSTGNLGIGTNTPLDKLHVVGNIRMVDGAQTAGDIMVSDANGTASWVEIFPPRKSMSMNSAMRTAPTVSMSPEDLAVRTIWGTTPPPPTLIWPVAGSVETQPDFEPRESSLIRPARLVLELPPRSSKFR